MKNIAIIIGVIVAFAMVAFLGCSVDGSNPGGGDPTPKYLVTIQFADWDKAANQIGGDICLSKTADESKITDYIIYWGDNDNSPIGDPIVTLTKTGSNQTYTLPDGTMAPTGASKMLAFVKTTANENVFSGSVFISDITCLRVSDINPGSANAFYGYEDFYIYQNKLLFAATDGSHGSELFGYDGTNSPGIIADINSGTDGSNPASFCEFNNRLFFSADNNTVDNRMFAYDGINPPALAFADTSLRTASSTYLDTLAVYNNKLFFDGSINATDYELWGYDGINPPGMVYDINSKLYKSSYPESLTVCNGVLYFTADDGDGMKVWAYADDGNNPVKIDGNYSYPENLTVYNNKLYFSATDGTYTYFLWCYDGQSAPKSIIRLSNAMLQSNIIVYNNKIYTAALIDGCENLWSYDEAGNLKQMTFSTPGLNSSEFTVYNGKLYFQGYYKGFPELYSFDETNNQLNAYKLNRSISMYAFSSPSSLSVYNNTLYFSANCGDSYGKELWSFTEK
jgi:ELWxxDGT repeat protein